MTQAEPDKLKQAASLVNMSQVDTDDFDKKVLLADIAKGLEKLADGDGQSAATRFELALPRLRILPWSP